MTFVTVGLSSWAIGVSSTAFIPLGLGILVDREYTFIVTNIASLLWSYISLY